MRKKNIAFWVLVFLLIGFLIFSVIFVPITASKGNKKPSVGTGGEDEPPTPPPHEHVWTWQYLDYYNHIQVECHTGNTRNSQPHVYSDDEDKICNLCEYERKLPTKQDQIEVEVGEDGTASVGGLTDPTVTDLVVSGSATDSSGNSVDVVEITDGAFANSNGIVTVTILDGIKTIGKNAFEGCHSLKEVIIPKSVTTIDTDAFKNCDSLEYIVIDINNPVYMSVTNCIIRIEDRCLIVGCNGSIIPTRKDGSEYIVTSIGVGAFYGSGIKELDIPNNITEISTQAFENCKALTKVTGFEGITKINDNTFNFCSALTSIVLHDGITAIGKNAFAGCASLTSVTLSNNLKTIEQSAFKDCTKLKSITLPLSVTAIDIGAFGGCTSLSEIVYMGTAEEWAKVAKKTGWKPDGVEVTFTQPEEQTPDPDDGGDDNPDTGNGGTDSGDGDGENNGAETQD